MPRIWIIEDDHDGLYYSTDPTSYYYTADVPQADIDRFEVAKKSYYEASDALVKSFDRHMSKKDRKEMASKPKFWRGISSAE